MGDCEGEVEEKFLLQKRDMEVPSCTDWSLNTALNRFQPNTWVEVGKERVDAKVKALSMYCGVMRPFRIQDLLKLSKALLPIVVARLDVTTQRPWRW